MSDPHMLITVTQEQQIEIENICINQGKTLSQYFQELHEAFMGRNVQMKEAICDDMLPEAACLEKKKIVRKKKVDL